MHALEGGWTPLRDGQSEKSFLNECPSKKVHSKIPRIGPLRPPGSSEKIDRAVQKIIELGGPGVRFIILYGSASDGRTRDGSDIDICVYYDRDDASELRPKILSDLFDDDYDIKIFQQLPLPLRIEVLKGKVLYCDDPAFMYDKAYETIKEFESFKHRYYDYIGLEAIT